MMCLQKTHGPLRGRGVGLHKKRECIGPRSWQSRVVWPWRREQGQPNWEPGPHGLQIAGVEDSARAPGGPSLGLGPGPGVREAGNQDPPLRFPEPKK